MDSDVMSREIWGVKQGQSAAITTGFGGMQGDGALTCNMQPGIAVLLMH